MMPGLHIVVMKFQGGVKLEAVKEMSTYRGRLVGRLSTRVGGRC